MRVVGYLHCGVNHITHLIHVNVLHFLISIFQLLFLLVPYFFCSINIYDNGDNTLSWFLLKIFFRSFYTVSAMPLILHWLCLMKLPGVILAMILHLEIPVLCISFSTQSIQPLCWPSTTWFPFELSNNWYKPAKKDWSNHIAVHVLITSVDWLQLVLLLFTWVNKWH